MILGDPAYEKILSITSVLLAEFCGIKLREKAWDQELHLLRYLGHNLLKSPSRKTFLFSFDNLSRVQS